MDSTSGLNPEVARNLKKQILALTHSGDSNLAAEELTCVKAICSDGNEYLRMAYKELMRHLKETHSEVRFSTVQLIDELFEDFEDFRPLIIEELDQFFKLGIGLKSSDALPPPAAAADKLLKLTIATFHKWFQKYGSKHSKIRTTYKYLKNVQNIDFSSLEIVDPEERKTREEKERRLKKINSERLKNYNKDMKGIEQDIESTLTSLETCFQLLLPSPDNFDSSESTCSKTPNDRNDTQDYLRVHGIVNPTNFKVDVVFDDKLRVKEDEENSAIVEAAKDSFRLINNSFLPKVTAWVELIKVADGGSSLLREAITLKGKLESAVNKYHRLEVIPAPKVEESEEGDEVSSDSDLEEVVEPKPVKKSAPREEIGFLSKPYEPEKNCGNPVSASSKKESSIIEKISAGSNERKRKLLEVAPKLPFDVDLYHWEDEKLPTPTLLPTNCEGSHFWAATTSENIDEIPIPGGSQSLRTRVIEFSGEWKPVDHVCNAPMPSGRLCPRKDRVKCPLHGLIVKRDEKGNILNPEDEKKVKESKSTPDVPDWQDPKLLAELKAQTGLDLKMPEKGKRKKKEKFPGLTHIETNKDTPKARLSKKIFNKASVKKVAAALDQIDHRRHRDKFGDQFNYMHDTT